MPIGRSPFAVGLFGADGAEGTQPEAIPGITMAYWLWYQETYQKQKQKPTAALRRQPTRGERDLADFRALLAPLFESPEDLMRATPNMEEALVLFVTFFLPWDEEPEPLTEADIADLCRFLFSPPSEPAPAPAPAPARTRS